MSEIFVRLLRLKLMVSEAQRGQYPFVKKYLVYFLVKNIWFTFPERAEPLA